MIRNGKFDCDSALRGFGFFGETCRSLLEGLWFPTDARTADPRKYHLQQFLFGQRF